MAGDGPRDDQGKRDEPEIAAADLLFRDEPAEKPAKPAGAGSAAAGAGETFDLVGGDDVEDEAPAPPIPVVPPTDRAAARSRGPGTPKAARARESYPIDPEDAVDVVWSRGAEWGPNLLVVGAWLSGLAVLVYLLMGWSYGLAFVVLLVGGVGAILLSYPMLITLERPVRITPEQAVKDYYGALSHHIPHYRRMWLLLACTGRTCASYGSFEGFRAYWNDKLRTIKGSQAGAMTPLVFEVENFRSEKSAGKSQVDVKFTLKVSIRGRRQAGPIASIPGQVSLVRGPDKMWYLEEGTLPHARREGRSD